MYNFVPQLTKLLESDPLYTLYYTSTNGYYTAGYGMPNCTCYALGRILQLSELNLMSADVQGFLGNGGKWGEVGYIGENWERGDKPMLGSVVVFKQAGADGHVGIVEEINSDGTITTSNSGWSDTDRNDTNPLWWWKRENLNVYDYGTYEFQYFLYPPYINMEVEPEKQKSWIPLALCNAMEFNL